MLVYAIDDEPNMLYLLHEAIAEAAPYCKIEDYSSGAQALSQIQDSGARPDVVFSDIRMPGLSGLEFAARLSQLSPETKLVFVTSYDYAIDAYQLHVNGYITKPVEAERVREELNILFPAPAATNSTGYADFAADAFAAHVSGYAPKSANRERLHDNLERAALEKAQGKVARVEVRTFGNFDLLVDGRPVHFARSKAKEIFAYLIDRRGRTVTRREAFAVLWEHGYYNRPMQKQLDVAIRSMRETLDNHDVGDIVEMEHGTLRIVPELVNCDLYRFIDGDPRAIDSFFGEYMATFPWARTTESYLAHMKEHGRE